MMKCGGTDRRSYPDHEGPYMLDLIALQYIPKPKLEWTSKDRTRNNRDNIFKDILFKYVDETIPSMVKKSPANKELCG